jgi:hypothetical protein
MPVDALADLCEGDLQVIAHLEEGWGLGLIFVEAAREKDLDDAQWIEDTGTPVLWLHEDQLRRLASGQPAELFCQGERYLIAVEDVEDLEALLQERREMADDED